MTRPKDQIINWVTRTCLTCKKKFECKSRPIQLYCHILCRPKYYKTKEKKDRTCDGCGINFQTASPITQKFCNKDCRLKAHKKIPSNYNPDLKLNTGIMGAIGELSVCVDLLKRGYEVFRSVSATCSCDLAMIKNHKLYRIEVKTGYLLANGKLCSSQDRSSQKFDFLAIINPHTNEIIYEPELP